MWPIDDFPDFPDINVHSYIGVIIAIAGNILISVALNIQKYAHNQLQPSNSPTDPKHGHPSTFPYSVEEEGVLINNSNSNSSSNNYNNTDSHYNSRQTGRGRPAIPIASRYNHDRSEDSQSFPSSRSSSRSSIHSHHSDHNSDTSEQSETLAVPNPHGRTDDRGSENSGSDTDYLRSKAWWIGMILMILGECGNFLAYGYAQASIIAPLGTVALVSNVILAPLMLREPFRSRDLGGILIAIVGTVVVVINSKENEIQLTPEAMTAALLQTQFLVYFVVCCVLVAVLASLSETIGSQYIFIDLSIVAIFGGYTVLATKGVSSLLSLSFYKMFTYPIAYLLVFVLVTTAVLQIKYLNKSLQRFDSTQVIPTQFVLFTTSAIIGSAILYNDFDEMDFNKGLNFFAGCCMTFLGVYFITSHRDKDGLATPAASDAQWIMATQQHYAAPNVHRASIDSYASGGRPLYPQNFTRSDILMEQGSRPPAQNLGIIVSPNPNRPVRASLADYGRNDSATTPLLGTSFKQPVPGPKDAVLSSITSGVHNVLSAVGARHTSSLGLDQVIENYKNEERRSSIHSLSNHNQFIQQRPGLGSRSSSACSGAFPPPSIATHPSSTSLLPPEPNYGSSYQSPLHPLSQVPPLMQFSRTNNNNNAPTFDPRFQAPHLQERSLSQDSVPQKQPRHKASMPHLTKEQREAVKEGSSSVRAPGHHHKTSGGVAVPLARRGDRYAFHSPSEHEFIASMSQSIDSVASSVPKASAPRYLSTGALLSVSPTKHGAQGSEYAIHTIKSPPHHQALNIQGGTSNSSISNPSAANIFDTQSPGAQLPPLPPSVTDQYHQGRKRHHQQPLQSDSDSTTNVPLTVQGKRRGSQSKNEGDSGGSHPQ
ncbi:hypothetical protein BGZ83_008147 [Gryganskiella cystojenkinii]|nr:hypothetical protein BGZ83_008147 [Gryganskiella cystojenkinii]